MKELHALLSLSTGLPFSGAQYISCAAASDRPIINTLKFHLGNKYI